MNRPKFSALAGLLAISGPWAAAQAQSPAGGTNPAPANGPSDQVEEIIVTATRRETSLQHTPVAVSAFTQAQLDRQQVVNVVDLQRFVPSLQFNQQADNGAVLLTLRGIGNDTAFTATSDPEVAVYVDGIYSPRPQGGLVLLYDLERTEVLRGPQGTLFGRNTTAGAVSLTTAKAKTDAFSAYAEVIGGDYNRFGVRGAVNVPLTDTLAFRVSYASERHDGYASYQDPPSLPGIDSSYFITAGKRYYAQDQQSARVSAVWEPNSQFRWNINTEVFLDKGAPDIPLMQTPRPGQDTWSILADTAPDNDRYAYSTRSTMDYEIGDHVEATYIAGYNRVGGTSQSESDDGVLPILTAEGGLTPYGSEANRTIRSRYDFYSHELQFKSKGKQLFDWIVGGIYSHEKNNTRFDIDDRDGYRGGPSSFGVSFFSAPNGYKVDTYAGFGQATWNATDRFRVTGGARYSSDKKADDGSGAVFLFGCPATPTPGAPLCRGIEGQYPNFQGAQLAALLGPDFHYAPNDPARGTFNKVTWLGRAEYDVTSDILAYGSVGTGFKSGIVGAASVGPETLTDFELGAKTKLFDGRATLNLAAYYYDFKGYQIGQIAVVRDAAGNIISSSLQTLNAQGAKAYGLEAEAVAAITQLDHVQFSAALQKTKLKSLLTIDQRFDGDPTDPNAQQQLEGNELPHAPRFSSTLTYEHDFQLGNGGRIVPRGTLHYETASWLSIFNGDRTNRVVDGAQLYYGTGFDRQKSYTRSDLAVRYEAPSDKYVLEAFVQNVEDSKVRTSSSTYGLATNSSGFLSLLQAPRTFGVRLRASF